MNSMIAFCGLNCGECEAYLATKANDQAAKDRIAAKWQKEFNAPGMTADSVTCDGCTVLDGHPGSYCRVCEIRACGIDRKLPNCAHCDDYDTCEKLAGFLSSVPAARTTLGTIRRAL
jgi:hypothetical protein